MTPGARLQAAIEILEQSFAAPFPADAISDAYFRRRRYAGSGDRRAVQERVFGMLRRHARLEWHIERACARVTPSGVHSHDGQVSGIPPAPRALALADLIVGERLDAESATRLFGSSPHAPAPLAETEMALARALQGRALDDPAMPDSVRFEYPAWLESSLRATFGERLAEEMSALNRQAPLDLRVNAGKRTRDAALAALAVESVAAEPTPLSPLGLRIKGAVRIGHTRAFKQGLVEVQDEGSQIVAALVGAKPGMTVVDFCAGAGGKTLALAAAMSRKGKIIGRLIACDTSPERLRRMTARLERAGAENVDRIALEVVRVPHDASPRDENDPALGDLANTADRVLLDVPCSGSGAWRRDPLGKWRFLPDQLAQLVASQHRILAAAARLVRPGGRLVYATCSVLPEENEVQVELFLEHHNEFQVVPIARAWSETLGGVLPAGNQFLRLTPAAHGTDGFFAAVLERGPPRG
ncbi:MAG: RsmB/NOP family class I SAM-dependent RNA methyltransferase [Rhodospirillales bacterium]|nr:RsmB/NOP family class I SAM-dependent RNA methyltransferase [Rhodospirillales bacterium]MSP80353.1 RsmB/NOP family class I SAM-dependent RNA methyltransferase [Rhodospirillales bacterium]